MTRKEIAKELANRSNLTPSQATHAVEGIIEIIEDALAKDEPILLRGFGTIKTVQRAAKPARNISKGTTAMVARMFGRNFIGFELNPEYMDIINKKIIVTPNMFYQ